LKTLQEGEIIFQVLSGRKGTDALLGAQKNTCEPQGVFYAPSGAQKFTCAPLGVAARREVLHFRK